MFTCCGAVCPNSGSGMELGSLNICPIWVDDQRIDIIKLMGRRDHIEPSKPLIRITPTQVNVTSAYTVTDTCHIGFKD